jgi:hypothetical protein
MTKTWGLVPLLLGLVFVSSLVAGPERRPIELGGHSFDPLVDGEPALPAALRASAESKYAIVQLDGSPEHGALAALRAAGVVFHDPIAGNAYLVRLAARGAAEIAGFPHVRWVGALHGAYKIDPSARGGKVRLDLFPDADVRAVEAAALREGASVIERSSTEHVKLLVVEARGDLLPALAAIEGVRWVQDEPIYRLVNDDARFVVQANRRGRLPLYEHGLSGLGQVGAVSDSGLDAFDFDNTTGAPVGTDANDAGCYFVDDGNGGLGGAQVAPGPTHRKVVAYTVPSGATGDYTDEAGHGTHVVGSIVGDQAPWGEVSPSDGQAYAARIFFQDINVGGGLTVNPPSDYFNDLFGAAYDPNHDGLYDPALEPRTHSNSWGSADSTYDSGTAQVDEFMWVHPEFLILYAAGNNGPAALTVGNPGTAKNIVTVGATENGDGDPNAMAQFSSHGPIPLSGPTGGTGRLEPTIGAPGVGVSSALYKNPCGTQELDGTSMATPTTQGVALLMRQYLWDGYYPHGEPNAADAMHDPPPSAALLKALLVNSGERMTGLYTDNGAGGSWPSNGQGWGRVTADQALYFQGDHRDTWLADVYSPAGTIGFGANGETRSFTLAVGDGAPFEGEPLEITLVWSDYPGSMLDGGRLVNNLDLVVTDPQGGIHRGNDPAQNDFQGSSDLPPAPDAVNPWEVVYLAHPAPGTYTISVRATALGSLGPDPGRKQGFALVATGDLRGRRGRAEIESEAYNPIPTAQARLRVIDLDRNANPLAVESLSVRLTSTANPAGIALTLFETSASSATFVGTATLVIPDQGQILGPGQLAVEKGNTIRLEYTDADDGTGHAYTAFDTARIEDPVVALVNPPVLADPGDADTDGSYTISWAPGETSNNRGLEKTLAYYLVEEATDYTLALADDAEGTLETYWTAESGTQFSLPWTKSPAYNHTANAPAPGESYWSQNVESGANLLDADARLVLTEPITIPAALGTARLTFYSRYFNEPDDAGTVEVSTDGGTSWSVLLKIADAPQAPPADTRMQHHDVDLTAYRGTPIRLRFRFVSTSNYYLFTTLGWWIDDIVISGASWHRVAVVPPDQTSLPITDRIDGGYAYRVRSGFTDGSASAFSNVETIVVALPNTPAGRVPSTAPLLVGKGGGDDVTLAWGDSCVDTDTDYEVYEGTIGIWYSHEPRLCSTGGALSATLTPAAVDTYYLVVPRNASREGSYGTDSAGQEVPLGSSVCLVQTIEDCN